MGKLWDGIESVGKGIGDVTEDVYKGGADALKGGWEWAKDVPGQVNREMGRGLEKMGVGGKLADDPLESIGAVIGTVIGGMYALPAMGVGAAGSAGAAGAGAGSALAGGGISGATAAGGVSQGLAAGAANTMGTGLTYGMGETALTTGTSGFGISGASSLSGPAAPGFFEAAGNTISGLAGDAWGAMGDNNMERMKNAWDAVKTVDGMTSTPAGPSAPAFRPSFQRSNSTGMADQLMQQEMQGGQGGYGQLNIR